MARYLSLALADPYSAVRYVAGRSLRTLGGFADFSYDYLAPQQALRASVQEARARAAQGAAPRDPDRRVRLLLTDDGGLDPARAAPLLQARDDRLMEISE